MQLKVSNRLITPSLFSKENVISIIEDLVITPRLMALEWSKITKQTPNLKVGYPGQHIASIITGVEGEKTGARGNDLKDGTELKSCSRIDQMDKCKQCKLGVARIDNSCENCGSEQIKRVNDSKWLLTLRSEEDVDLLLNKVPRILFLIGDYPNFSSSDFDTLRFQAFEIWPNSRRSIQFRSIIENYYYKIFLEHKKISPNKTPAPKNFWPYSYQFYLSNPIKIFECEVKNANTNDYSIKVNLLVEPNFDRNKLASEEMPLEVLNNEEIELIRKNFNIEELNSIDEEKRSLLSLRDTDKISLSKSAYKRRGLE